ncbi:MAG: hypothetical protein ACQEQF_00645 [Bacillota bacterium]
MAYMNRQKQESTTFLEKGNELSEEEIAKVAKEKYEDDIVDSVKKEFKERSTDKLPLVLSWRLLMNFLDGNQHVRINTSKQSVDDTTPIAWWEEREVFDQLSPILETRLAKLNRADTELKVRPATSEMEDISSAKVETRLLEGLFKKENMEKKQKLANLWSEKLGTVFWKTGWDESKGRVVGIKEIEEDEEESHFLPEFERELRQYKGKYIKKIHEGDVDVMYCTPFEIFPDSMANADCSECRDIIHAKAYNTEEIFEMFGENMKGSTQDVLGLEANQGKTGGLGQKNNDYRITNKEMDNACILVEKWELPTKRYPQGRLIMIALSKEEEKLLHYGKLPDYLEDQGKYELPFISQKSEETGEFFGKSVFERLLPLQRRYNSLRNRKKEYLNRVSIGQLTYEENSIDEDFFEEEALAPGAMIAYKQGSNPPSYLDNPRLPSAFDTEENTLQMDFNRISGVSEISRDSSAPTGVGSGVALSILKEQDDTRISLPASYIQQARIQVGKKLLKVVKEKVDYPRKLKYAGKDEEVALFNWDKNDITSFDVYVESKASLSETPAQRRQFVFDLFNAGLFNPDMPEMLRAKLMQMLELGNWEDFVADTNLHIERAKKENMAISRGKQAEVWEIDDHEAHLKVHTDYMVSSDFAELIAEQPELKERLDNHRRQHLEIVSQKQRQVAKQEMETQQQGRGR